MPELTLAARLRAGETLISGWSTLPDPAIAEVIARAGFDCVAFDTQHGLHDIASVTRGIAGVIAAGRPALVRVPLGDNAAACRFLDLGAEAVIAPMISSAAEARALLAATKYPPVGERSWGPGRALLLRGVTGQQHLETANASALVFAMIESRRALDALDDIVGVEGLDGVFVGPSDLSLALFDGKRIAPLDPALGETIALIARKAIAAGKFAGIFAVTAARAVEFRAMGFRLIALGSDQMYLEQGAKTMLAEVRQN
jgi:4-hydroxy-2-oxoheptanedioate aldolase